MKKCPYCRELIQDDAIKCHHCGSMMPSSTNQYNPHTPPPYDNSPKYNNQPNYGYNQPYQGSNNAFDEGPEGKSRGVAALLAILLGGFGVQYFYLGKTSAGIIALILCFCTCGIWQLISIIQGIMMFCMSNDEFRRKYILNPASFPVF